MAKHSAWATRSQPPPPTSPNGHVKPASVDPRLIVVPEREDAARLRELGFDAVCFSDVRGTEFRRVLLVWNENDQYVDHHMRGAGARICQGKASGEVGMLVFAEESSQTIRSLIDKAGWDAPGFIAELSAAKPFLKTDVDAKGLTNYQAVSKFDLGITSMSAIETRPVSWLWRYRLAHGEMALVAGEGGLGKSQVLLKIAACVSTGALWPDGSGNAPRGRIVILSAEDDPSTTIKPRLLAMGADVGMIDLLSPRLVIRKPGEPPRVSHKSFQDLEYWETVLDRIGDVALFIVDPLPSYLGRGVNDSRNNELREILEPFVDRVIRPRGICLLANSHLNKSTNSRTPMERILGSVAYGNIARNVHFVARDPDDPARRFFKQAKCNIASEQLSAMAFRVEQRTIPSELGDIETAIPVFEDGPVQVDLDAALSGEKGKKRGPEPVKITRLAEWLVDFLKDRGLTFLGAIADAAGGDGLLGAHAIDTATGKGRWKGFTSLYEARRRVAELPAPREGWCVITSDEAPEIRSVSNAARWQLRRQDSPY